MDDDEKTQHVAAGASQDFDPDKTTIVPNTPRPAAPNSGRVDDAEKTHLVGESVVPPRRPAPTGEGLYPPAEPRIQYPSTGPNAQRSPSGPPAQYPGTGTSPQRAQSAPPPPAAYRPPAGPPPQQPAQPYPPANYGPPPSSLPPAAPYGSGPVGPSPTNYGPSPQQPHGYAPQHDPYAQPDPYAQQQYPPAGPYPGQPDPQQPGPVQSPLGAANAALAKGGSFIARLIQRGMYGELIKNPWFQQTRQQSPDQFVYIGFGIGVVLALLLGQIGGGLIGDLLTLAIWSGLAYTFFAIGTKKAVQFVAYGICIVGPVLYLWGAIFGLLTWSELASSPYASLGGSSIGIIILVQSIASAVFAALLIWAGVTVHRTIKKLSGQQ
jgi:hypothetical protein